MPPLARELPRTLKGEQTSTHSQDTASSRAAHWLPPQAWALAGGNFGPGWERGLAMLGEDSKWLEVTPPL